jgi:hypothetical protein
MQKSYSRGISLTRNDRLACDESLTTRRIIVLIAIIGPLVTITPRKCGYRHQLQNRRLHGSNQLTASLASSHYRIAGGTPVAKAASSTIGVGEFFMRNIIAADICELVRCLALQLLTLWVQNGS